SQFWWERARDGAWARDAAIIDLMLYVESVKVNHHYGESKSEQRSCAIFFRRGVTGDKPWRKDSLADPFVAI
ncbi:MAG: hypothetical protein ACHQHK_13315, partial [Dongiales bacterium]